jgi:hypothetical protein
MYMTLQPKYFIEFGNSLFSILHRCTFLDIKFCNVRAPRLKNIPDILTNSSSMILDNKLAISLRFPKAHEIN